MGIAAVVGLVAVGLILIALAGYFISIYNGLIRLRRNIDRNWSNIDVLLKQRYDEIGKLVKVCDGYMKYERATLEKITALRSSYLQTGSVEEKQRIEGEIAGTLKTLFALAENYPDLKANQNFVHLQDRISELENEIADRRELYNESVNLFNIRIHQIPDIIVARMAGYTDQTLFQVAPEERRDVEIKFDTPK
jgi:LemA protein